jgi:hypothetical protein
MKRRALWITVVGMFFVVFLMGANVVFAEKGNWTYGTPILSGEGGTFTGEEAIVTVNGTVKKIEPIRGQTANLQMLIKDDDQGGSWVVYMGPKWFVENQKIKFAKGDKVEVRGKKTGGAIIASEISKDNWTMRLRNEEDGQASWQCCFPYKERKD